MGAVRVAEAQRLRRPFPGVVDADPRPAGDPQGELIVLPRRGRPRIARGPRVGVDYAGEWAAEPLRFCDADSPHVSRPAQSQK